jgi:hypothetical protein
MDYEVTEETGVESISDAVRRGIRGADPSDVGRRDWLPVVLALRGPDSWQLNLGVRPRWTYG